MSLMDIISNAATGGILGSIGGIGAKYIEGKHAIELKKLDNEHEARMSAHELALTTAQLKSSLTIAELDARKTIAVADANLQAASYAADTATYSKGWEIAAGAKGWIVALMLGFTDSVRGLMRPMLTAMLVTFNVVIAFWLWEKNGALMDGVQSYNLLSTLINNIALCTSLAISWWFGARSHREEN